MIQLQQFEAISTADRISELRDKPIPGPGVPPPTAVG